MTNKICTVVVPIYNSLHAVRPCFDSVLRWTDLDRNEVILVNDASDEHTSEVLRQWSELHSSVSLVENEVNVGFVRSCNRALAIAESEFVVLLNSDTCVTPRWLEKMIACMRSDDAIAIASPVSNFAPYLRIEMAPGADYLAMNAFLEDLARPSYPDVTTPEGFCYMIRTCLLDRLGLFDLVFDDGYGEESDLAMRANYLGYRTVCVDDTYIYHQGRGTFGSERRRSLYERNRTIFNDRWSARYSEQLAEFRQRDPLAPLRAGSEKLGAGLKSSFDR